MNKPLYAVIEAGGTKFNIAVGSDVNGWLKEKRIPTDIPSNTLNECIDFLKEAEAEFGSLAAIGIAAFGPIALKKNSKRYGTILNTPKQNWSNVNLVECFAQHFKCPVSIDTDVNAAALAEHEARGLVGNLVYITVGTGVGVGVCIDGVTLKGELHPELGHLAVSVLENEKLGVCAIHGACVEGLISGPALKERWDVELESIDAAHPLWESSAYYLAHLCSAITLAYSPYKIVLGGGVANSGYLLEPLRSVFPQIMANYLPVESFPGGINNFIELPIFTHSAGLVGALRMAEKKYNDSNA